MRPEDTAQLHRRNHAVRKSLRSDHSTDEYTAHDRRCGRQASRHHIYNRLGGGAYNVGVRDSVAVFPAREHPPQRNSVRYGVVGVYVPTRGACDIDHDSWKGDWIRIPPCVWHGMLTLSFLCPQRRCAPSSGLDLAALHGYPSVSSLSF